MRPIRQSKHGMKLLVRIRGGTSWDVPLGPNSTEQATLAQSMGAIGSMADIR